MIDEILRGVRKPRRSLLHYELKDPTSTVLAESRTR
jgi:hypothetical protein